MVMSRRALHFLLEGERKKGRLSRTWRKQVEEINVKAGLSRVDHFADQSGMLVLIK